VAGLVIERIMNKEIDFVDQWIQMVATNRLTGHSPGFFSVYTLPPNQAVTIESQKKINKNRNQVPEMRDVKKIIIKKSKSLLADISVEDYKNLKSINRNILLITGSSDKTKEIKNETVNLVVTSPPFLDTVDYNTDNWLRCWFNNIDSSKVKIWKFKEEKEWQYAMKNVFKELNRILKKSGKIAFEVGEVRNGKVLLENLVIPAAIEAGLKPTMILINDQIFTKTSNCWGVDNLKKGTNTNRIVLLTKN